MTIFEHTAPTSMIWLGLAAALAVGAFSVWRYAPRTRAMAVIGALHVAFLFLLLWCLFLPGRKSVETHTLKPRFVVALDTSQSMLLSPAEDVSNRWTRAREILDMPWTRSVGAECRIDVYTFDTEVVGNLPLNEALEREPAGTATLLREALTRVTGRYAGVNVAGGLLLSDGLDTREAFTDWASEDRPFPLYTVRLEPDADWAIEPDLRVDAVHTPRRVTVDWETELKAVISGQGTRGRAVNVQLFKDGVLTQEQPTQVPDDGGSRQVSFRIEHPEIGVFTYRVVAPPLPGEGNTNDNAFAVSVQVVDARNRLIYVEGSPRWESKYLKRALEANEQVTPLIFVQGPGGRPLTFGAVGSMTADLTDRQLAFFKIVVIGNLDAEELGPERARNVRQFVDSGGSLVLLGGAKAWSRAGFVATPLKELLPVKSYRGRAAQGEFPVALTDEGRAHQAFAGDPELWAIIPPVLSVFPGAVPSPAARVLVEAETPQGPQPMVLTQPYGQGKVVAIFTDSLWKWKLHPNAIENRPYQRFWDQLIAWLLPEEDELDKDKVDLFADKETLVLGEEIAINARLGGEQPETGVTLRCRIERPDGTVAPFSMRPEVVTTGTGKAYPGFVTTYETAAPGLHTVTATAEVRGKTRTSDPISFFVKPFSAEMVPRPVEIDVLKTIARASGGRFFEDPDNLNDALSSLRTDRIEEEVSEYRSLWQQPWVIACLFALATLSWVWRKLNNMP